MVKGIVAVILIAIIVIAGYWYYKTNIQGITPIGNILKNPERYEGKSLNLKGKVTERVSFMNIKYFKLKDRSGEIIVMTENELPSVDSKMTVRGIINNNFFMGGERMLVFMEKKGRTPEKL